VIDTQARILPRLEFFLIIVASKFASLGIGDSQVLNWSSADIADMWMVAWRFDVRAIAVVA
jgi:hypothetical protein